MQAIPHFTGLAAIGNGAHLVGKHFPQGVEFKLVVSWQEIIEWL